jgi:hypothetical protein
MEISKEATEQKMTFDELVAKYKQLATAAMLVAQDMEAFKHLDHPEFAEVKLFNAAQQALALVEDLEAGNPTEPA